MKIHYLDVRNYRCFSEASILLSEKINVFVGANNSGKSSILKCVLELQQPNIHHKDCRQKGAANIRMEFKGGWLRNERGDELITRTKFHLHISDKEVQKTLSNEAGIGIPFSYNIDQEPNNLIYPFLSKRKISGFDQNINLGTAQSSRTDLLHLNAKIDRLADIGHPKHSSYKKACEDVLGFYVHCQASPQGKQAGILVNDFDFIPIESMGEGVGNLLGMIVNLCVAKDKIFIVEEPENDIHPKALKTLLNLILESSVNNQFFISTHSNIVVSKLGTDSSTKIFSLNSKFENKLPTSTIEECKEPEQRRTVLEDLGYEISDVGLWKGWLILEESSAESVINSFLIPRFAPNLAGKIRTFSSRGYHRAREKFDKLHEQFLFLHLTPAYKNKAWIILDGGAKELEELVKLKEIYVQKHNWNPQNFKQLSEHDFENYYPFVFTTEIKEALSSKKENLKKAKEDLLLKVMKWIEDNPKEAKEELAISAKEVIEILREIEKSLLI